MGEVDFESAVEAGAGEDARGELERLGGVEGEVSGWDG